MINILIPLAGKDQFFPENEYHFPKSLTEFLGKTMIEHLIGNLSSINLERRYIFIINADDAKKYHLDSVLNIVTNNNCQIIKLDTSTKGAACSAMMAVDYIDNDMPLIISNPDQLFDVEFNEFLDAFKNYDAGVVTFESVHPRWSYVRVDEDNNVVETAEKRPISKHAIAGLYYYKNGKDFMKAAGKMIYKDANVNGSYYISPTMNELTLDGKKVTHYQVRNEDYHTFYTPQKIKEYERLKS